jgi:hypothetical protein
VGLFQSGRGMELRRLAMTFRVASAVGAGSSAVSQALRMGASGGAVACACTGVQASRTATKSSVDLMRRGYHPTVDDKAVL